MGDKEQEVSKSEITELTKELHELVGEFRGYRKETDELKSGVKDMEVRLRTIETKIPSLEEMKENHNKIRNSIVASITVAVIVGGIIGKFSGA